MLTTLLLLALSLPGPAQGAGIQWVNLTPGTEFEAPGGLTRITRLTTEVRFPRPDPDYGQVEFGRDVDGDGRKDHTWCGEVAALTLYNLAVAEGLWSPVRGFPLTPEALERVEVKFERCAQVQVEDDQYNAPMLLDKAPYFPTLAAIAGGPIGALVWSGARVGLARPEHAIVVMGASASGDVLVVKDCAELQGNRYDWRRDYFLVDWITMKAVLASIAAPNEFLAFFPLPQDGSALPGPAREALSGLQVTKDSFKWREDSQDRSLDIFLYQVSSLDEALRVLASLAYSGIPVLCLAPTTLHAVAMLSATPMSWEMVDEELRSRVSRLEMEVNRLSTEMSELRRRMDSEEGSLREATRRLEELEKRVSQSLDRVEGEVSEVERRVDELEKSVKEVREEVNRLRDRVSSLERGRTRGVPILPVPPTGRSLGRSGARRGRVRIGRTG
ncbi:MAG: hypothetical protein ABGY09_05945 [Euryarchaeota archaeon]